MQPSKRAIVLCKACEALLPWLGSKVCQICSLEGVFPLNVCPQCTQQKPPYRQLKALFDYQFPIDSFIRQFKYRGHLFAGNVLAHLMAEHFVADTHYDCVIAVPLHPRRQRERGFNQTLELAKVIAKKIRVPLDRNSCSRSRNTRAQSSGTAKWRHSNIKTNHFRIDAKLRGKTVLIIEDVVTTGSTVNAFAQALLLKGVKFIDIWACCRTLIDSRSDP